VQIQRDLIGALPGACPLLLFVKKSLKLIVKFWNLEVIFET
jgi:hypothetical protein